MKQLITIGISLSIYTILLFTFGIEGRAQGTAQGDFNSDGYADLAIGVPYADVLLSTGEYITNAGEVHIIYGSADGLYIGSDAAVPSLFLNESNFESLSPYSVIATADNQFGKSVAAGDFNGDGFSDLAIGVSRSDVRGNVLHHDVGHVLVMYGSSSGLDYTNKNVLYAGSNLNDRYARFGHSLTTGDFNKDGVGDLAVGAPGWVHKERNNGHVTVFYGLASAGITNNSPQTEISQTPRDMWGNFSDYSAYGTTTGYASDIYVHDTAENEDQFGETLAAGDFDGDGDSDLVVGVPHEDLGSATNCGMITIIKGSSSGLTSYIIRSFDQDSPGVEGARESGDLFGDSLAVGDFNDDGKDDLAVGVPYEDKGTTSDTGAVNIIYGGSGGISPSNYPNDQIFDQDTFTSPTIAGAEDLFGWSVAAGDFNGDGKDELAVGSPRDDKYFLDQGFVHIYKGSSTGLSSLETTLDPYDLNNGNDTIPGATSSGDQFGYSLSAHNFGKTSHEDLVIGIPFYGANDRGAINVIYGSTVGVTRSRFQFVEESMLFGSMVRANDRFGSALY